jgi:hypothetical protein
MLFKVVSVVAFCAYISKPHVYKMDVLKVVSLMLEHQQTVQFALCRGAGQGEHNKWPMRSVGWKY